MTRNPWSLYDELIETIPEGARALDCQAGVSWTMVRSDRGGVGLAHTVKETSRPFQYKGNLRDAPLRSVARCIKSWNMVEASIGMAAINAWYNTEARLNKLGAHWADRGGDVFTTLTGRVWGKKVAVVGHFPNIERKLKPVCHLTVLERNPQQGDYPDGACEYLLPEQDFVFLTGMTLVNKTLPRLLELSSQAEVSLVGPSVPLTPILLSHGLQYLSGYCVTDLDVTEGIVRRGGKQEIFEGGRKVELNFLMG